jgi:hypothetical protein
VNDMIWYGGINYEFGLKGFSGLMVIDICEGSENKTTSKCF